MAPSHPMHLHLFPFQLQEDVGNGWDMEGDFIDDFAGVARTRINFYGLTGKMMFHCHIAKHSDQGMMAIMYVDEDSSTDASGNTIPIIAAVVGGSVVALAGVLVYRRKKKSSAEDKAGNDGERSETGDDDEEVSYST